MIFREINLDFPYERESGQELLSEDDLQLDYELNWKWKRRELQLMTRCMTSMIERIMPRITTKDCWKIIIECVQQPTSNKIRNMGGGVCHVQVPFEIDRFREMSSLEKKAHVINKVREALVIIAQNDDFDVTAIANACDEVVNLNYINEWYWKKPVKSKHLSVQVKVSHEVEKVNLYFVFKDSVKNVSKEVLVVSDLPDEWAYFKYFGKLEWVSDGTAKLTTKNGECFIATYE